MKESASASGRFFGRGIVWVSFIKLRVTLRGSGACGGERVWEMDKGVIASCVEYR
jgi:hypothetical protein